MERLDASFVFALSLLQSLGDLQCDSYFYRGVRLDDWVWEFLLLSCSQRFLGREIFANDVAFELLRFVRVHCAEKRLRFILHLPYAHAVYALRVLFAVDF